MSEEIAEGWKKHSLELDLYACQVIGKKVRVSALYSQNLYAALCNIMWEKTSLWTSEPQPWGCSWISSGAIVANIRMQGDYLDWYCTTGIDSRETSPGFVREGVVTDEIRKDLSEIGWQPLNSPKNISE